ncbi:TetR family transcriptional regulator C-terminal domain-containing protein [Domibacillus indicus]|uniref:TetR-like C-terminal domain-containing protein n=1 Tax=Domibacillus indicus TaxID=1437523 RepID=UPI00203C438B|nr:TetR-like C-terminal domain-containing protein [Domibacillus indicus]MCM3788998.1 TetR family transcriptional regulator C-terminal domain-containing protein [Domibacillus indicus]
MERFKITLRRVFENIEENRFFYEVMLGPNGIAGFTNKIEKFLFEKFKENFKVIVGDLNNLNIPADFILHFISSAYIGVVKWWLSEDTRHSPEYLAEVITKGPMNAIGYKINFKEEDSD